MRLLLVFVGVTIGVGLSSSLHWFSPHRIAGKDHLKEFPVRLLDVEAPVTRVEIVKSQPSSKPPLRHSIKPDAALQAQLSEVRSAIAATKLSVAAAEPEVVSYPPAGKEKTYTIDHGVVRPKLLEHVMYVQVAACGASCSRRRAAHTCRSWLKLQL